MNNVESGKKMSPLVRAIKEAYSTGQEDESLEPIVKVDSSGKPVGRLGRGEYVIFYDIRGEREVEITRSLTEQNFPHFPTEKGLDLNFVTMIEYDSSLKVKVAFPPEKEVRNTLTEVVTGAGLKLIKIAESEKAVHIGYFMNGKRESPFPGEERIIVPSPEGISSFAARPEMSAALVSGEIRKKLADNSYRLIVANLANVDVVGHTEDKAAVIRAVETVDSHLGKITEAARSQKVTLIVTSDHGTVEDWLYPDGAINTGHTQSDVPFILAVFSPQGRLREMKLRPKGELADVAPTVLELLGIEKPVEMSGRSLAGNNFPPEVRSRRVLLLILDGWGYRARRKGNLIFEAKTPNFDRLWKIFPHSLLKASGEAVGMPPGSVGNSEAGHLHIGAGRRIVLDRVKIDRAISDGSFFRNEAFLWAMENAKKKGKALHLLGIVSFYSSHGTLNHLFSLLHLAKKVGTRKVYIHSLIGRRGEKPESGARYVEKVENMCCQLSVGEVVTVMGRFWALDREENWHRIEKSYRALVYGEATRVA